VVCRKSRLLFQSDTPVPATGRWHTRIAEVGAILPALCVVRQRLYYFMAAALKPLKDGVA
jgi:hypothetical protein